MAATDNNAPATNADDFEDCRMYENVYPEHEELVMVNVRSVTELGAYVSLLEYNNIEGMILLSELSRKRIRSIPKLIRVGRNEVVVVVRVDKEKGYIDLSKRRVSADDIALCEDKYNKSKAVHGILKHMCKENNMNLLEFYEKVTWPLYKKYGHAFIAFKQAITNEDEVFEGIDITPEHRALLMDTIRLRLAPTPLKIRADIEVTCFSYEGINAIKTALNAGKDTGTEDVPVSIRLLAPPLYVLVTNHLDKDAGIAALQTAIDAITTSIEGAGGSVNVKEAPRAVSDPDEAALQNLMEELERMNQEVAGDDYSEEEA